MAKELRLKDKKTNTLYTTEDGGRREAINNCLVDKLSSA
jgi:hypothetical protein